VLCLIAPEGGATARDDGTAATALDPAEAYSLRHWRRPSAHAASTRAGCCSPGCRPGLHRWQAVFRAQGGHLRMAAFSSRAVTLSVSDGSSSACRQHRRTDQLPRSVYQFQPVE
jgi:hypothetical protein